MDRDSVFVLAEEDLWRANMYAFLASLLREPPRSSMLKQLASLPKENDSSDPPLAVLWKRLAHDASIIPSDILSQEYHTLFIGVIRGEVVPYASYYLSGFLMEKPLAALRAELHQLGIVRQEEVYEPEDHAAAICETMSLLVRANDPRQCHFFQDWAISWLIDLFSDIEKCPSARFYRAVAGIGRAFFNVELKTLNVVS